MNPWFRVVKLVPALLTAACNGDGPTGAGTPSDFGFCSIPQSEIFSAAGRDGIPSLSNPALVTVSDDGAGYLLPDDRVIGLFLGDAIVAIPLNIMWWHEIVNLELNGLSLAVTHCPLTGSSLAFDRAPLDDVEFGVSGLLYLNNLLMFDRASESLWPQLSRGARCGAQDGESLSMYPVVESSWHWWTTLHPDTRVVSSITGFSRDYTQYPYGSYRIIDNTQTLIPVDLDLRRPPKERVLGIPGPSGGIAYPFLELSSLGTVGAVEHVGEPADAVVLWDARANSAMAYIPEIDGAPMTFAVQNGVIVDNETGSTWQVDGTATVGPLAGRRLDGLPEAYVAYWFGWAAFEPNTAIWTAP